MISYTRPAVDIFLISCKSLQGHSFGSHIFMADWKTSKNSAFFKSAGTTSQILGQREHNYFVPSYAPLVGLDKKSGLCLNVKIIKIN